MALEGMTKGAGCWTVLPRGIRVNAAAPTFVERTFDWAKLADPQICILGHEMNSARSRCPTSSVSEGRSYILRQSKVCDGSILCLVRRWVGLHDETLTETVHLTGDRCLSLALP